MLLGPPLFIGQLHALMHVYLQKNYRVVLVLSDTFDRTITPVFLTVALTRLGFAKAMVHHVRISFYTLLSYFFLAFSCVNSLTHFLTRLLSRPVLSCMFCFQSFFKPNNISYIFGHLGICMRLLRRGTAYLLCGGYWTQLYDR